MNEHFFIVKITHEIVYPVSATFNSINGTFDTITGYTNTNTELITYPITDLICYENSIQIAGIGKIRPGDLIKIHKDDENYYTLDFGWYTTNEGLDLFGWYLHSINQIKPFYENYIKTIEVVKFNTYH